MEVSEWFASRDAAYDEYAQVEGNPDSTDEDIDEAWLRYVFVRRWLNRWKIGEPEPWLREFEVARRERIGGAIKRLPKRQPELGEE